MPFGILSAPQVFQRRMHQFAEGLSGVEVIHEDFIIVGCGKTYEEGIKKHDKNLIGLLLRCQDQYVTLCVKEATYLG